MLCLGLVSAGSRACARGLGTRPSPSLVRFRTRSEPCANLLHIASRSLSTASRPWPSLARHSPRASPITLEIWRIPRPWPGALLARRAMSTSPEPHQPSERQYPSSAQMMAARRKVYAARNRALLMYSTAFIFIVVGITYASVPLYRAFCAATGFAGTPQTGVGKFAPERLVPASDETARRIKVNFNADTSDALPWGFAPQQKFVYVVPGQTALAFYTARNRSDRDIIGIATYSVAPAKAAPYFAKVECFCFEEQKLLAGEEVDLPLFFFIDKDFLDDPLMRDVDDIVLSYTFFRARRNQRGQLEPDANEDVVQASLGFSDYELAKKKDSTPSK